MKKILCLAIALLILSLGTAMAAPLNDLSKGQTAVGVTNDSVYIEHKIASRVTLGIQNIDLDNDNTTDFYGQYHFTNNLRGIIGTRDYNDNSVYFGIGCKRFVVR